MAPHSRGTPIIEPLIVKQELPDNTKLYHTRDQRRRQTLYTNLLVLHVRRTCSHFEGPRSTEVGGSSFRFSFGLLLAVRILHIAAWTGISESTTGHTRMTKASSTPTPKIMKRPLRCSSPEFSVRSCAGLPDRRPPSTDFTESPMYLCPNTMV